MHFISSLLICKDVGSFLDILFSHFYKIFHFLLLHQVQYLQRFHFFLNIPMQVSTQQSFELIENLLVHRKPIQLLQRCRNDIAACQHGARLQRPWISDGFSAVLAVDGAVAQGENSQILFRAALHAGEHLRCFSADCDRPQFEDAPDQAEILFSATDGVHRHVQKVQHLGFIVSFLAEIFGQFQKIKAVINAGLHLRQVEEVFFNVCAGEGVAVTALVDLKLAEDERRESKRFAGTNYYVSIVF